MPTGTGGSGGRSPSDNVPLGTVAFSQETAKYEHTRCLFLQGCGTLLGIRGCPWVSKLLKGRCFEENAGAMQGA